MTGFDEEMRRALEADGEILRELTGDDHGPWDLDCSPVCTALEAKLATTQAKLAMTQGWLKQEVQRRKDAERDKLRAERKWLAERSRANVNVKLRESLQKRLEWTCKERNEAEAQAVRQAGQIRQLETERDQSRQQESHHRLKMLGMMQAIKDASDHITGKDLD